MTEEYYTVMIFQRKKDLPELKKSTICVFQDLCTINEIVHRRLIYETIAKEYKARIYVSVNPRNTKRAKRILLNTLLNTLLDNPESTSLMHYVFSSLMLSPHNTIKRFIIDVDEDTDEVKNKLAAALPKDIIITKIKTKNGYHLITHPFDIRIIQDISGVELKKDGMTDISFIDFLLKNNRDAND